jgi:hypothetical protein
MSTSANRPSGVTVELPGLPGMENVYVVTVQPGREPSRQLSVDVPGLPGIARVDMVPLSLPTPEPGQP